MITLLKSLVVSLTTVAAIVCSAVAAAEDRGRNDAAAEELTALEFIIGDWDLATSFLQTDGSRRSARARLSARYSMGGYGVEIEETHPYGAGVGGEFVNTLIYTVHPKTRQLVGASNNTLGNRKVYDVTISDDQIIVIQSGELFEGRAGSNRLTYFNITSDRYELRLQACRAEGEDCNEGGYSYVATRVN